MSSRGLGRGERRLSGEKSGNEEGVEVTNKTTGGRGKIDGEMNKAGYSPTIQNSVFSLLQTSVEE